ncbi:spermine oxidase-like [Paramacrobiotus metropolitanus]|uniref:spermine oxidase-like n=1 Tax=Paramacrobiotus metropolitanus TaxID=2943436 RepID=UPI002445AC85|nr:spermine oxidase-like [Paramacrobiotus metropolitanus]
MVLRNLKYVLLGVLFCAGGIHSLGKNDDAQKKIVIDPHHIKVVVVGAGMAGLSAAQRLLEKKFDVTVLEGGEAIGGRIHSVHLPPVSQGFVEEGAQIVYGHGELPTLLRKEGWLKSVGELREVFLTRREGQLVFDSAEYQTMNEVDYMVRNLFEPFESDEYPEDERKLRSVGAHMDLMLMQLLIGEELEGPDKDFALAAYDSNMRGQRMIVGADSLYDVAADEYVALKLGSMEASELNVPWSKVVELFSKNISQYIQTNKLVKQIEFKAKKDIEYPVTVKLADGTKIKAHHVIFTGSLGVLKASHATLFSPNLSKQKQKALALMGFAKQEKLLIVYEEAFWDKLGIDEPHTLRLFWDDDLKPDQERRYDDKPWYRTIDGFNTLSTAPTTLEAIIVGKAVDQVAELSDEQLADDITDVLKRFLKRAELPRPKFIMRTSYTKNPLFLGAKTYYSFAAKEEGYDFRNLSKPTWQYQHQGIKVPALMFAGEATHPQYFSTVQGAVESGWREAKRLLKYYNFVDNKDTTATELPAETESAK